MSFIDRVSHTRHCLHLYGKLVVTSVCVRIVARDGEHVEDVAGRQTTRAIIGMYYKFLRHRQRSVATPDSALSSSCIGGYTASRESL